MMKHSEKISTNSRVIKKTLTKYKDTFIALCELFNNSLQAQATAIDLKIDYDKAGNLKCPFTKIEIKDNGHGVSLSDFKKMILEIGTDVKAGGEGIGRFGALQLGDKMTIETVAYDKSKSNYSKIVFPLDASKINSSLSEIDFEYDSEILNKKANPYYKVIIEQLHHNKQGKIAKNNKIVPELLPATINQAIFEKFPLLIFNRNLKISVNGKPLDPKDFVIDEPSFHKKEFLDAKGNSHEFDFQFYQIKSEQHKVKVFFCIENGGLQTVAHEFTYSSGWYTPDLGTWFIYMSSSLFSSDLFRNIDMDSLGDTEMQSIKDFCRDIINEFFKSRNKKFEKFVENLQNDKHYPETFSTAPSKSREAVFQKVAYLVEDEYQLMQKDGKLRGLLYSLIDKALSSGYIEDIFKDVIVLSDENLQKFHSLLQKTELADVISFSSGVADKIEFLDFLHELIYGDLAEVIRERSQLHKIIQQELWLFGEGYAASPHLWSDKKLGNILNELREKYFSYIPSKDDENLIELKIDGADNITDLFFLNEKILDNEDREVMVVELKSPKCAIGKKELQQIDEYAFTVENTPGLPKENIRYKFILISSKLTGFAKSKLKSQRQKYTEPFLYDRKTEKNIDVYVMEWSELLELNKRKLGYLSTKLKVKDKSVKEKFESEYPEIINVKVASRLTKVKGTS